MHHVHYARPSIVPTICRHFRCQFFPNFSRRLCNQGDRELLLHMDREIRALLDHAAYCRQIAAETTHESAAHRLRMMATEYECRVRKLITRTEARGPEREISKVSNLSN